MSKHPPLSREDVAKLEIGETTIQKSTAALLVLAFLLTILSVPSIQAFKDKGEALAILEAPSDALKTFHQHDGESLSDRVFAANSEMLAQIQSYETNLEDNSFLVKASIPRIQSFSTAHLGLGNEQAYVGRESWLFYRPGVDYLTGPGFLDPSLLLSRSQSGSETTALQQPDPRIAIADMKRQLDARGITLIVMPVPVKAVIRPDRLSSNFDARHAPVQNPSYAAFIQGLKDNGTLVYDPSELLANLKSKNKQEVFLKTDTHWRPEAMQAVAADLAAFVETHCQLKKGHESYRTENVELSNHGDISVMLNLPTDQTILPPEPVVTQMVLSSKGELWRSSKSGKVLLLGDSFSNIYSLAAMNWGESAGFAEQLSLQLSQPIDALLRNDAGAFASRAMLANEMARGKDRLAGKKIVIWEFAARELAVGDWKLLDLSLGEKRESEFFQPQSGGSPQEFKGHVEAVSMIPRPGSVPYKDHVYALHLTNLTGPGIETPCDAVVYMRSMADGKLTSAARYRPGDSITLGLQSWDDVSSEYERFNRSELENEDLQFEPPCWGVNLP